MTEYVSNCKCKKNIMRIDHNYKPQSKISESLLCSEILNGKIIINML